MDEDKKLIEMQNELKIIATAYGELVGDFIKSVKGFEDNPESQFWRRMVIHTLFASAEIATFHIKQVTLFFHIAKMTELSAAEIAMLKEETYKLKSNGEAITGKAKLATLDNLKFAFRLFHKVTGTGRSFDTDGNGFRTYQKALMMRDKITHPKTHKDISIKDDQLLILTEAMRFIANSQAEAGKALLEIHAWLEANRR